MDEIEEIQRFYTALVRRNSSLIHYLCAKQSDGDEALCDDLTQEVLAALWLRMGSYRQHVPERVWLRWQVRSILYDYHRHRLPPPEQLTFEVADSLAEETLHCRERLDELSACLQPDEREMIRLTLEGYTGREVAERTGITPNAVYKRMKKAIEKMRTFAHKMEKQ